MLKKAGIVVAAAAAGLLALSPLAFAGDKGHDNDGHTTVSDNNTNSASGDENVGLVNVTGNNVNVPIQACNNDVPVNVLGVQVSDVTADLTGALGLLADDTAADDSSDNSENRSCEQSSSAGDTLVQNIED